MVIKVVRLISTTHMSEFDDETLKCFRLVQGEGQQNKHVLVIITPEPYIITEGIREFFELGPIGLDTQLPHHWCMAT